MPKGVFVKTAEHRKHIGDALRGKPNLKNRGSHNGNWVGEKITYNGLHTWVRRHKTLLEICELCRKKKAYDFANISGAYKRDVNDFVCVCRSCHMVGDGRIKNLKQYKQKGDCIL